MYPVGVLFGLGFDTATEVGLLTITAGVAAGHVPPLAIAALPVLFAAGMAAMDTADGVFMSTAYGWALSTPARKVYYNLTVTGMSVFVALAIGSVELLQVLGHQLALRGPFWSGLEAIDFTTMGYAIVGVFVVTWIGALAVWRWRRLEQRWQIALRRDDHPAACGDHDRLLAAMNAQLAQDRLDVRADRFDCQAQLLSHLFGRETFGQQRENFPLARRQA
jgi:high-affinity nickel-transport protein